MFSEILLFLFLEAKFNFETKLERDMNFEWILDRYLDQKSVEIGLQMHSEPMLDTTSFSEPFSNGLEGA